jgi:hypothetical protein
MGVGGKAIPPYIDRITDITSDAEFIILVEKEAAYMRLAEDRCATATIATGSTQHCDSPTISACGAVVLLVARAAGFIRSTPASLSRARDSPTWLPDSSSERYLLCDQSVACVWCGRGDSLSLCLCLSSLCMSVRSAIC